MGLPEMVVEEEEEEEMVVATVMEEEEEATAEEEKVVTETLCHNPNNPVHICMYPILHLVHRRRSFHRLYRAAMPKAANHCRYCYKDHPAKAVAAKVIKTVSLEDNYKYHILALVVKAIVYYERAYDL